jgi:hypothetical protein
MKHKNEQVDAWAFFDAAASGCTSLLWGDVKYEASGL